MKNFNQTAIEHTYQNWAKVYDWLTPAYLPGNEKRLRFIFILRMIQKDEDGNHA